MPLGPSYGGHISLAALLYSSERYLRSEFACHLASPTPQIIAMRNFLLLLSVASATAALDFVSTDGFFSYSPTTEGAWGEFQIGIGAGCSTKTAFGPSGPGSFTFTFPQASTSFQWFGFQSATAGLATVCFDGQTGSSCEKASYFAANITNPISSLYRKTGLSNALHTVTVTNIADPSHGSQFGQITVDKVVLDGSTRALPSFPADSFLTEIPLIIGGSGAVLVNPLVGSGPAGIHGERVFPVPLEFVD
jgi:hypothetical protein